MKNGYHLVAIFHTPLIRQRIVYRRTGLKLTATVNLTIAFFSDFLYNTCVRNHLEESESYEKKISIRRYGFISHCH